jgi:tRNA G18 (ribose-2'-O)-methylase SpoU
MDISRLISFNEQPLSMATFSVQSLDDPRLDAYRNMKDKELARYGRRFIAEGENVVKRLLASGFGVESILVAERKRAAIEPLARDIPLFFAPDDVIDGIIGFNFHGGVLACGIRPESPLIQTVVAGLSDQAVLVICQEIANSENLGALIRISAAFGAAALVVGERCCDPFFRQCVRVSMGSVFKLPIVRAADLGADLSVIKSAGFEVIAAVLAEDAENLRHVQRRARVAIALGNEAQGLDQQTVEMCDRRVTIPMKLGTDSLNVVVAAAVFLFQLSDAGE